MNTDPLYFQKGFGLKGQVQEPITADYTSGIVDRIRDAGYTLAAGDVTIHLAKEFGFCYGVERTVQYAYETLLQFPGRRIFITDEIIHNPYVNERLIERGMRFLFGRYACGVKVGELTTEDIVLLPAFGVTTSMLTDLKERHCVLVDTTCGSVLNVWKNVEKYARDGFTAVVHGKYDHEETRATVSQALKYPNGRYIVVRDLPEARIVCDYIERGGLTAEARERMPATDSSAKAVDRAAFLARFARAVSPGFDPDRDLSRVALANQTTMLMSESLAIERMLRESVVKRYGADAVDTHHRAFDTICSATQDRQDAIHELMKRKLDLVVVIGGFNSSNTGHLAEIAAEKVAAFHVQEAADLVSADVIRHRDPRTHNTVETRGWLPAGPIEVGVTSGASTPNSKTGAVIARLLELRGA
jgi:4-hydroxy-3-methylbut-2-enyl diphosphate reductase